VLWGGLTPAVKVALRDLPPLGLAGVRFGLAGVALWAWCRLRRISLTPERDEWGPLVLMAFWFVAQIAAINTGVRHTSAAHAIRLIAKQLIVYYININPSCDLEALDGEGNDEKRHF